MDITMCSGKGCEFEDKCYRFTAKKSEFRQSYFFSPPLENGRCYYFWGEDSNEIYKSIKDIFTDE